MPYCYILKSTESNKYYIGCTNDLMDRLALHNAGKVKSTKHDRPWTIIYSESFESLSKARKRELQIKNWKSRKAMETLMGIKSDNKIEDPRFRLAESGPQK